MASRAAFLIVAALVVPACAYSGTLRGSLDANMQPEAVAKTLKKVEDSWKAEAAKFIECNATGRGQCSGEPSAFSKSCAVVMNAVVQGSSGDQRVADEYMANICNQALIKGWHQQHCMALKAALGVAMTADSYQNRNNFVSGKLCNKFWGQFVEEEKKRFVREEAERKEAEKKAAEEAAKKAKEDAEKAQKAKEEAAAREKKAKEDAEKKKAEELARQKIEEAKRVKEEAQAKAAKAAEQLAKKKAEAEEFAKKAAAKMAEAAEAEEEHKKAQAKLTDANSTVSVVKAGSVVEAAAKAVVNATSAQKQEEVSPKLKTVPVVAKDKVVAAAAKANEAQKHLAKEKLSHMTAAPAAPANGTVTGTEPNATSNKK